MADDDRPPLQSFLQRPPLESFAKPQGVETSGKIPQKQMGMTEQFLTGVQDPLVGGKQLLTHIAKSPEEAQKIDTQVAAREHQIAEAGGRGLPGVAGQMVGTAPLAALGPLGIGGAVAGGVISGALQPAGETAQNFWSKKAEDVVTGAVLGGGTYGAVKALGAALGPKLEDAEKWLVGQGVQLTPGQIFGGIARRAEEAFKSRPILGYFIAGAQGRGIEGFNKAIYNQTLEPLKGIPGVQSTLDPSLIAGRNAFKFVSQQYQKAYDTTLQGMRVAPDHDLGQDLSDIRFRSEELGPDLQTRFNNILKNRVATLFGGGQDPKTAVRDLAAEANRYRRGTASEQAMAGMFDDAREAIIRATARQNPQKADQLRTIDQGYAMFARVRDAVGRRATSEGVFTPADLLSSIKSQDKTRGKQSWAEGNSLLQLYAQYGQKVLPPKMPDSGTAERVMWAEAAKYVQEHPLGAMMTGVASLPYTRPGMALTDAYLYGTRATAPIGSVVRKTAPYVAPGGGYAVQRKTEEEPPQYGGPQQ